MMDPLSNQFQVTQLHNWLSHWHDQFGGAGSKGKGKKLNDAGAKKAVLLSGTPGIGKTTSAKLVSQMLGFQAVEVSSFFFFLITLVNDQFLAHFLFENILLTLYLGQC